MSWMIFFSVSPFGIRKFSNIVQISLEIVLHVCIFSIIWFQNLHISDDLEERKQQDNQLQCLVFCIFCIFRIFCISEFARVWRRGSTEATRQVGRMSGKSTTRTVWPGPPSRTIFPTHFASTSSSSSTHSTSSSHNLQHSHHVHSILSSQVFVGQ